jgi:hypothetical protein
MNVKVLQWRDNTDLEPAAQAGPRRTQQDTQPQALHTASQSCRPCTQLANHVGLAHS